MHVILASLRECVNYFSFIVSFQHIQIMCVCFLFQFLFIFYFEFWFLCGWQCHSWNDSEWASYYSVWASTSSLWASWIFDVLNLQSPSNFRFYVSVSVLNNQASNLQHPRLHHPPSSPLIDYTGMIRCPSINITPCLASEKMWENFKLGKILENRNKNVKWNTVTYPLNLPCQWSFVTHYLFPSIILFALLVLHQTWTRTSHMHAWRHNSIIPMIFFFFFHDYYICRKTWNSFFMTTAFEEKLENFKELILCNIRYIKYLLEKQGCK